MDFLQSVAEYHVSNIDGNDWNGRCFVFPSHRASVFYRKALQSALSGRTVYGYKMLTLDEFVASNAKNTRVADNITLVFKLYEAYCEVMKDVDGLNMKFDNFYSWSSMFLGDFSDIDKYMLPAKLIFKNVEEYEKTYDDLKFIGEEQKNAIKAFWNIDFNIDKDGNEFVSRYFDIYERMYDFYKTLHEKLLNENLAYSGMLYRQVADMYVNQEYSDVDTIYSFIGFNALTTSEKKIFEVLQKSGRAMFFWDYTDEMLKKVSEEDEYGPGRFIRQNLSSFPMPKDYHKPQLEGVQNISITNFAYPQGQVAKVNDFLSNVNSDIKTAVVLADENMLVPVILAMPENVENVNVSMGYPLKFSPVYGLVELLMSLQLVNGGKRGFYYKTVIPIMQNPCVQSVIGNEAHEIVDAIIKGNIVNVDFEANFKDKSDFVGLIFRHIQPSEMVEYIYSIFERVLLGTERIDSVDNTAIINRECVNVVLNITNRFDDIVGEYLKDENNSAIQINGMATMFAMFNSLLKGASVDFNGEQLKGVQVLGILETRAIDFDNLIVLDMNEGVFPKGDSAISFIPYVIRKNFGLPTHEFQDSIYSYYFFRLISRAKNVDLLYTVNADSNRQGMSRYLQQLIYQYDKQPDMYYVSHEIKTQVVDGQVVVRKTNEILERMKELYGSKSYLSPSALSLYIECPVKFFLSKVLGITEVEDVTEDVDNRQLGNIFHNTMESLYEKQGGRNVEKTKNSNYSFVFNSATKQELLSNVESEVKRQFVKEMHFSSANEIEETGRNAIVYNVICNLVKGLVKREHDGSEFVAAEYKFDRENNNLVKIVLSNGLNVRMGGSIDRQHIVDGVRYVVDYKTGKCPKNGCDFDEIDSLYDRKKHNDNKAVLQTLLYCMFLYMQNGDVRNGSLRAGVIYLKQLLGNEELSYVITKGKEPLEYNSAFHEQFKSKLIDVLEEIFSPSVDFVGAKVCPSYCTFKQMCSKYNGNNR